LTKIRSVSGQLKWLMYPWKKFWQKSIRTLVSWNSLTGYFQIIYNRSIFTTTFHGFWPHFLLLWEFRTDIFEFRNVFDTSKPPLLVIVRYNGCVLIQKVFSQSPQSLYPALYSLLLSLYWLLYISKYIILNSVY